MVTNLPNCTACFGWCSIGEIEDFWSLLPTLSTSTKKTSPWVRYLTAVYQHPLPADLLPLDLRSLGFIVMPATTIASARGRVPFDVSCEAAVQDAATAAPRCRVCRRWLDGLQGSRGSSYPPLPWQQGRWWRQPSVLGLRGCIQRQL